LFKSYSHQLKKLYKQIFSELPTLVLIVILMPDFLLSLKSYSLHSPKIFLSFPKQLFQELGYRLAKDALDLSCDQNFPRSASMVLHDAQLQA